MDRLTSLRDCHRM